MTGKDCLLNCDWLIKITLQSWNVSERHCPPGVGSVQCLTVIWWEQGSASFSQPAQAAPWICLSVCLCLQTVFLGFGIAFVFLFSFVCLFVPFLSGNFPPRSLCFNNKGDCFWIICLHLLPVFVHNDSVLEVRYFCHCWSVLVLIWENKVFKY